MRSVRETSLKLSRGVYEKLLTKTSMISERETPHLNYHEACKKNTLVKVASEM